MGKEYIYSDKDKLALFFFSFLPFVKPNTAAFVSWKTLSILETFGSLCSNWKGFSFAFSYVEIWGV